MSKDILEIFVDGACSGNPGPAGIGVVIKRGGKTVVEISRPIGEATNNIAEYSALVCALQEALVLKAARVNISTDSELMFHQLTGSYKVKDQKLKFLHDQVQQLKRGFANVELVHVPREKNKEADKLATSSLHNINKKQAKMVATLFDSSESTLSESEGSTTAWRKVRAPKDNAPC